MAGRMSSSGALKRGEVPRPPKRRECVEEIDERTTGEDKLPKRVGRLRSENASATVQTSNSDANKLQNPNAKRPSLVKTQATPPNGSNQTIQVPRRVAKDVSGGSTSKLATKAPVAVAKASTNEQLKREEIAQPKEEGTSQSPPKRVGRLRRTGGEVSAAPIPASQSTSPSEVSKVETRVKTQIEPPKGSHQAVAVPRRSTSSSSSASHPANRIVPSSSMKVSTPTQKAELSSDTASAKKAAPTQSSASASVLVEKEGVKRVGKLRRAEGTLHQEEKPANTQKTSLAGRESMKDRYASGDSFVKSTSPATPANPVVSSAPAPSNKSTRAASPQAADNRPVQQQAHHQQQEPMRTAQQTQQEQEISKQQQQTPNQLATLPHPSAAHDANPATTLVSRIADATRLGVHIHVHAPVNIHIHQKLRSKL